MKRTFAALVALSLGLAVQAQAQTGAAHGNVLSEQGEPVVGASVVIEGLGGIPFKGEVTTNDEGRFSQIGLRPGNYRFTVAAEGFGQAIADATVSMGNTNLPDIVLGAGDGVSPERKQVMELFQAATGLAKQGKLDEAEAKLQEAIGVSGDFPEAYYNLGYIHIQREEWEEAETALKKAIDLRPAYADAKMSLSSVYQKTGRGEEAQALIAETAESGDANARTFFNLGIVKFDSGDAAAAVEAFQKAEELDPENAEVQYYLGTLALQQGQTDESIRRLEKYLSMSPTNQQNVATAQGLLQAIKP
jgi:tetratricopeptide (TPR) repeat protein